MSPRNRIHLANIFAKYDQLGVREMEDGSIGYFGRVEDWLVKEEVDRRFEDRIEENEFQLMADTVQAI